MMNANEIRLGIYVNVPNPQQCPFRIDEIDFLGQSEGKVGMKNFFEGKEYHPYTWYLEELSPIEFTDDWHEKFGVQKNGFHNFEYIIDDRKKRKKIIFSGDYIYLRDIDRMDGIESHQDHLCTLWNNDIRKRKIYVHEFQNLYYCLTGKELKIV